MRCVEIFPLLGRMQTTPQFAGAHAAGAHICLGTVIFHRRMSSLTRLLQGGKAGPNAQLMILLTSPHTSCHHHVAVAWLSGGNNDSNVGLETLDRNPSRHAEVGYFWYSAAAYYAGKKHNVSVHSACTIDLVSFES